MRTSAGTLSAASLHACVIRANVFGAGSERPAQLRKLSNPRTRNVTGHHFLWATCFWNVFFPPASETTAAPQPGSAFGSKSSEAHLRDNMSPHAVMTCIIQLFEKRCIPTLCLFKKTHTSECTGRFRNRSVTHSLQDFPCCDVLPMPCVYPMTERRSRETPFSCRVLFQLCHWFKDMQRIFVRVGQRCVHPFLLLLQLPFHMLSQMRLRVSEFTHAAAQAVAAKHKPQAKKKKLSRVSRATPDKIRAKSEHLVWKPSMTPP